jgi:transposase
MRKIKEILRLLAQGASERQIAQSLQISRAAVAAYRRRAEAAGLSWPLPTELDDGALQARLVPAATVSRAARRQPDWAAIHQELRRQGVTLRLLWLE